MTSRDVLTFEGSTHFRMRLVCSVLSQRAIRVESIRLEEEKKGLADYEVNLLRLLEKVSSGCRIRIGEDGTSVDFVPGFITGDVKDIVHDCCNSRGIGYYVAALLCLIPFGKSTVRVILNGVTNHPLDVSLDALRTSSLPLLGHFGLADGITLQIKERGCLPLGGGVVEFSCSPIKELTSIVLLDEGLIRRVRGIAHTVKVPSAMCARMVTGAKDVLMRALSDVFVYTDHSSGGLSAGFGLTLVAESLTGALLCAEVNARPGELPEDVGKRGALLLLEEIARRGVCDTATQPLMILFMLLCDEEVSRLRVGTLSPYSIQLLRDVRKIFGVTFKIEEDEETGTAVLTCLGIGYKNLARKHF